MMYVRDIIVVTTVDHWTVTDWFQSYSVFCIMCLLSVYSVTTATTNKPRDAANW